MEWSRGIRLCSMAVMTLALCVCTAFGMRYGIRKDAAAVTMVKPNSGTETEKWTQILLGDSSDGEAGSTVMIRQGGSYRICGTLEEGQICVDTADGEEVVLCLAGVQISNRMEAAVYIKNAGKTTLFLEAGTENILQSGIKADADEGMEQKSDTDIAETEEDETDQVSAKAAVYARDDLTITGEGTLKVFGYIHNGIHTTNHLSIDSGTIQVEAANIGVKGKDSVTITGGDFSIVSGGDGIRSNDMSGGEYGWIRISGGTFQIESGGDGIQAETDLDISGGDFTVLSGGGSEAAPAFPDDEKEAFFFPGGEQHGMDAPPFNGEKDMPMPPSGRRGEMDGFPEDGQEGKRPLGQEERPGIPGPGMEEQGQKEEEDTAPSCKGLKSGTGMTISGGSFRIDACDDAFHSDGTTVVSGGALFIKSGDDGIHADAELTISGGTVEIGTCYEGLEANQIQIDDGVIRIHSSDDGINANGGMNGWPGRNMGDAEVAKEAEETEETMPCLCISGGTVLVNADGDGLDSNGNLTILGGTVIVDGPSGNGNGALDSGAESGGRCVVHGGLVLAIGSSGMAESFDDDSEQNFFSCRLNSGFQEGSVITVMNMDGQVLYTHTAAKAGSSVVFSCPELTEGETVRLDVDGEVQEVGFGISTSGFVKKMKDTVW